MIDATDFAHKFGEGVMEWRDDHVIPRYGAAGVRKFAFLMPGFPDTVETGADEVFEGPATFPTAWFAERADALDWIEKDKKGTP